MKIQIMEKKAAVEIASDKMRKSLSFLALLLVEIVTLVASSCINFLQSVFQRRAWQSEKTTPSTNNQTIDSNSAAFHQESNDTICCDSPEPSIPPTDTDGISKSCAFEENEEVVTKQPGLGGEPSHPKFKVEERQANPGCCVSCCGFWLECSDGIIP